MPQITVDYSYNAEIHSEAFVRDLHNAVVDIAAARPEACKTLFREANTGYGYEGLTDESHHVVHVTIGLLAGRGEETKARLTEAVLDLLRKHLAPEDGVTLHASAEVRELDASYRKFDR
ncbi:5-carboxymethyl-2-hydroxymuconate Delta-isomerase [Streptomyces sp. NBC_00557]|uniref:5-carboxymethyl-2-hydroxymuconate Delta-isomerase n=1 Tax=Streptomyces sp. NBC_00557 TaxID=2975776 RepID=UPI002E8247B2|nr:isomerase [Streptomyces sp. NBC_00557]WUC37484.1 isomerase [Streptomyces sp. NBC_00557]